MSTLLSMVIFLTPLWSGQIDSGTLSGTVRDEKGNPKVGVLVVAISASATRCADIFSKSTKTDGAGDYRLEVKAGEYLLVTPSGTKKVFYPRSDTREKATIVPVRNESVVGLDVVVPSTNRTSGVGLEFELLTKGVEMARLGCHSAARLMFYTFLTTYEDSELASEAKYEYAESYYREGSPVTLQNAKREFSEYLLYYPNAPRSPEAEQRLLEIEQK